MEVTATRIIFDYAALPESTHLFRYKERDLSCNQLKANQKVTALHNERQWTVLRFLSDICTHLAHLENTTQKKSPADGCIAWTPIYNRDCKVTFSARFDSNAASADVGIVLRPCSTRLLMGRPDEKEHPWTEEENLKWKATFEDWRQFIVDNVEAMWPNAGEVQLRPDSFQLAYRHRRLSTEPWMHIEDPNADYIERIRQVVHPYLIELSDHVLYEGTHMYRSPSGSYNKVSKVEWNPDRIRLAGNRDYLIGAGQIGSREIVFAFTEEGLMINDHLTEKTKWLHSLMLGIKRLLTAPAIFVEHGLEPLPADQPYVSEPLVRFVEKDSVTCSICMTEPIDRMWNCGHAYCRKCSGELIICSRCKKHKEYELPLFI